MSSNYVVIFPRSIIFFILRDNNKSIVAKPHLTSCTKRIKINHKWPSSAFILIPKMSCLIRLRAIAITPAFTKPCSKDPSLNYNKREKSNYLFRWLNFTQPRVNRPDVYRLAYRLKSFRCYWREECHRRLLSDNKCEYIFSFSAC